MLADRRGSPMLANPLMHATLEFPPSIDIDGIWQ
jgi:hypothetical protein